MSAVATAKLKSQGSAAKGKETEVTVPPTLPGFCLDAILRHNKSDAVSEKRGREWIHISGVQFVQRVRHIALGLRELGIQPGDRVGLISENRPEWSIVDLAILSVGAVTVPIYTTQSVDQIRFILEDSAARALVISGDKILKHARPGFEGLDRLEDVIVFDPKAVPTVHRSISLEDVEARGAAVDRADPEAFDNLLARGRADDLATIIYTSGTTGEPKGVMLTHENFISDVRSITKGLPISPNDVSLSVLPLSHIFERTVFYVFCYVGVSVNYAASFDQVGEFLREVRPTIMTAVPRLFEKVYHRIVKKGMSAGGLKTKIFERSLVIGQRVAELEDKKQRVPLSLRARHAVADRLVFSKWREGIGGRLRYFVSGGAPLSPTLSYSFLGAGIKILQGYGMTETCIVCANRPDDNRVGSIGKPFSGIEVAIAADGEMLVRGGSVMRGYYGHPEATLAVMRDEWFATGDVGYMDDEGHLFITDRKKDLFKLSNGKYIAPQQIESLLKQSEFVNQVVVVGSSRKYPAALIVPDWEALKSAMRAAGEEIAATHAEIAKQPAAVRIVQRDITGITAHLADYERVRRVGLLANEFSIEDGEMTPTLKVKRVVIDERYGQIIDEMYGGA
ncbi:MAG TPA: long-chain fatty acid--CoA ligase [Pyrinomonadaceae bacterium]|nr:long-chain fatty acid--CoA ligase [Pyrinomonadaceae bacterium]